MGLVRAVAVVLAVAVAFSWFMSTLIIFPPWHRVRHPDDGFPPLREGQVRALMGFSHNPRVDFDYEYEDVEFLTNSTRNSLFKLRGWFVPGSEQSDTAAVLAHGGAQDRREMLRHVPTFHEMGLHVLLFDASDTGLSDSLGRGLSFGAREHVDLLSAVEYLRRTRPYIRRVVLFGTSVGGASCLLAAASGEAALPIVAVVAENPVAKVHRLLRDIVDSTLQHGTITPDRKNGRRFPVFEMAARTAPFLFPGALRDLVVRMAILRAGVQRKSAVRHAYRITEPVLLIHGSLDTMTPLWHSEVIYERLIAARERELWIVPDATHAEIINVLGPAFRERVQAFVRKFL